MNFKQIICGIPFGHIYAHPPYWSHIGINCDRKFHLTCQKCNYKKTIECTAPHCDCCGGHCVKQIYFISDVVCCRCNKCSVKRNLKPILWKNNKLIFMQEYMILSQYYSSDIMNEAFSDPVYDDMREDFEKYKVLF